MNYVTVELFFWLFVFLLAQSLQLPETVKVCVHAVSSSMTMTNSSSHSCLKNKRSQAFHGI